MRKKNKHSFVLTALVAVAIVAALAATGSRHDSETAGTAVGDGDLLAVTLSGGTANVHIDYSAISVDFNPDKRVPNCVAYRLTRQMVMMADAPDAEKRKNYKFNKDKNVESCPEWWEYKNSGYDRGHMAPADDMKWSREAMAECFYMTNMCPQSNSLNSGAWRSLEQKVHRWASRDGELLVFTGPIFGAGNKNIGPNDDIALPQGFFKVVYAPGQQRAIAFVYDNAQARGGLRSHAVSVDEVERLTGIDFLGALPDDVESRIEANADPSFWLTTGN